MDLERNADNNGCLKISEDALASIAKYATLEIEGVEAVSTGNTGVKGLITKTSYHKPIKIEIVDDVVNVVINIIVKHGVKIIDVASSIQKSVKSAIQSMTGLAVARVDIVVSGIAVDNAEEPTN